MSITGNGGDLTSQWKKTSEKSEMLNSWHFSSRSLNISNCRFGVKGLFCSCLLRTLSSSVIHMFQQSRSLFFINSPTLGEKTFNNNVHSSAPFFLFFILFFFDAIATSDLLFVVSKAKLRVLTAV